MSGAQNQDIDLIDIFFYVKKRKRFILVFMVVIMTAVLLFLFANRNKVTLSNNIRINQTTPGILVSCYNENNNTQNGFVCQTAMTEAVIQQMTRLFHTSMDGKNRVIELKWSGDRNQLPAARAELARIHTAVTKWYASEYQNDRTTLDEMSTFAAFNSELYTRMMYLTKSRELYQDYGDCFTFSEPEIKSQYPVAIIVVAGIIFSFILAVICCLVRKVTDGYRIEYLR